MIYFIQNAVVGTEAEKPDPANPSGGAVNPPYALFIAGDTGKIYQSTGQAWVQIDSLGSGLTGVTTDDQGNMTVAGGINVGAPAGTLETGVSGDLFLDAPAFHAPALFTTEITGEPQLLFALGQATTPTSSVSLKGMPAGDPTFNDYFYAQPFTAAATGDITRVSIRVRLDPRFPLADSAKILLNLTLAVDDAGAPGAAVQGPVTIHGSQLTADRYVRADYTFPTPFSVVHNSQYWLQFYVGTTDVGYAQTFEIEANATVRSGVVESLDDDTTWTAVSTAQGTIAATLQHTDGIGLADPTFFASGIGTHGHAPQTAPRTLAQSVITAITDANAKTAFQACANALADMGALTLT